MNTYRLKLQGDRVIAVNHDVNKTVKKLEERALANAEAAPFIQDEIDKLEAFNNEDRVFSYTILNDDYLIKLRGREITVPNGVENGKYKVAKAEINGGFYEIGIKDATLDELGGVEETELPLLKKLAVGSFINLDDSVVWRVK